MKPEKTCADCGIMIDPSCDQAHEVVRADEDQTVCDACYADNYTYCKHCENYVHDESIVRIGDERYCEYCVDSCELAVSA